MNKKFFSIIISLLLLITSFSLVGCGETKDYNADIQVVAPEDITAEHFVAEEGKTYYTSPGFILSISVKGHFMLMDYFSLEGDKRVYDNLYLYEYDYFYIVTSDYKDLYASLENEDDKQYAEEEKESGYDIQLNIKKDGIYKILFDTKSLKFDLVYKGEIDTPRYYTMKNCSIFTLETDWVEMAKNPNNADEFYILNFRLEEGELFGFYNNLHVSNYFVTIEDNSKKYADSYKSHVQVLISGNYNVYVNSKTYTVRVELVNPETAEYTCAYYTGGGFVNLSLLDSDVPYVFTHQIVVDKKYSFVPSFYNASYKEYLLTVVDSSAVIAGEEDSYFFKEVGTYKLTIDLKKFEIKAEILPE